MDWFSLISVCIVVAMAAYALHRMWPSILSWLQRNPAAPVPTQASEQVLVDDSNCPMGLHEQMDYSLSIQADYFDKTNKLFTKFHKVVESSKSARQQLSLPLDGGT